MRRNLLASKIDYCTSCLLYLIDEVDYYFWNDEHKHELGKVFSKESQITHFTIEKGEEASKVVIFFSFEKTDKNSIAESILNYFKKNIVKTEKKIQLIGIVEKIGEKDVLLRTINNSMARIRKEMRCPATRLRCDALFMPTVDKKPITLNATRMNSLLFPEPNVNLNVIPKENDKAEENKGFLYVVPLAELVDIYDRVGDELFASNLRYGIEDKMSLESSMKSTLTEEPSMFWFYHNGITIVTEQEDIRTEESGRIILSESWKDTKLPFSVINGAQTISSVSRIFNSEDVGKEIISAARKNAKVLVRIITAKDDAVRRKITIALNRQKPIRPEDIAFQSTFVSKFNEFMNRRKDAKKDYLLIIKRGEPVYDVNTIELPVFAKLIYSCFMNPTDARNKGPANLYFEKSNYEELNEEYFRKEFTKATSDSSLEIAYEKYYQEVIWAYKLYRAYNDSLYDFVEENEKTILTNNRWSFISFVLMRLNRFSGELRSIDYSNFCEKDTIVTDVKKYMREFVDIVNRAYNGTYNAAESKSGIFWEKLKAEEETDIFSNENVILPQKEEQLTKQEFLDFLKDLSYDFDEEYSEYRIDVDTSLFSEITVDVEDDSFNISCTLLDVFFDCEAEDVSNEDKYEELFAKVLERFERFFGKAPEDSTEDFFCDDCPDISRDLTYNGQAFSRSFVKNFISLIYEIDSQVEDLFE